MIDFVKGTRSAKKWTGQNRIVVKSFVVPQVCGIEKILKETIGD